MKQTAYQERSEVLYELGFASYVDYLASDLWRGIRARVLTRDQRRCVRCGDPSNSVHHKSYDKDTLLGTRLDKLASICKDCHEYIEFDQRGKKQTLENANNSLHVSTKKKRRKRRTEPVVMCPICGRRPAKKERAGACSTCFLERPSELPSSQTKQDHNLPPATHSTLDEHEIAPRLIGVCPSKAKPSSPLGARLSTIRKSLSDNARD